MIEFECCECKRPIVAVIEDELPQPPLCTNCIVMPSWFTDPALLFMDPEMPWPWPRGLA